MIYRLEMPHSDQERFFPMYNIEQQYIEQFLAEKIAESPDLIDMRWQSKVIGVNRTTGDVELSVKTPEGEYSLRSRYLLAADGAKSRIREILGLRLKGENLPGHYVIADKVRCPATASGTRSFAEESLRATFRSTAKLPTATIH